MTKTNIFYIVGSLLLIALSYTTALAESQIIVSSNFGECSLALELESDSTLRLRAHHPAYKFCNIDEAAVVSILSAAFAKTDPPRLEGTYSTLFIGRLIDYPWLSQYLAVTAHDDAGWNAKQGKPLSGNINNYVSTLLFSLEPISKIKTLFMQNGYAVSGISVEKVLVGSFREIPLYQGKVHQGKIPFDAMVWLKLKKH